MWETVRIEKQTTTESLNKLKTKLGVPLDKRVIVCVGRLAKEKNTEELILAQKLMQDMDTVLLLVGDGPYRKTLEKLVEEEGLEDRVVFAGMAPPEDIPDYYRLGEIFVSASTSETQGLTYIEALAAGRPILCRKDPCLDDVVVQGENGWQYDGINEYRNYLREYLNHPEKIQQMQKSAVVSAEKFSVQNFAKSIEQVYLDSVERKEQHRRRSLLAIKSKTEQFLRDKIKTKKN